MRRRRRRFWIIVAVVAGAALLIFGRPGGDGGSDPPEQEQPAAREQPTARAPATGRPPAEPPGGGEAASATPSPPPEPVEPHDESGVAGDEQLDPSAEEGAVLAAEQFAEIWVTDDPQWHDRLAGLATPALAASLAEAEPPPPPGYRITGDAAIQYDAPEWARIGVPTGSGTLVLDVVVAGGVWLVSAVDWRQS